jgi:hypothetical protein
MRIFIFKKVEGVEGVEEVEGLMGLEVELASQRLGRI